MPANINHSFLPLIVVGVIALIVAIALFLKKSRKMNDLHIMNAFGEIPQTNSFDMDSISSYQHHYAAHVAYSKRIDAVTWNDLNMDEVFTRINACACSVGEEYLYHLLHELESGSTELEKREHFIKWLAEHPEKRLLIQKILIGVGKKRNNHLSYCLFHANTKELRFRWLYTAMALLPIAGLLLLPISVLAGSVIALGAIGVNIVIYGVTHMMFDREFESIQYFLAMLHGAKRLHKKMGAELCRFEYDILPLIEPFRHLGGFVSGKSQQGLAEAEIFVLIFKAVFLVDLIQYNRIVHAMNKYASEFGRLYETIGEIDSAICIASYRHSLQHYCVPNFQEQNTVSFSDLYHPLLANPITNTAQITNDSIITGSNASGKSTFIKTVAVNCILAQTIHTCCARQYKFSFSHIATSMALKDNILSGESYFITEIKSLQRIIGYCKSQRCIVFVDEILRGTNTPERIAASTAVLRQLHTTESLCIVASHDIELTQLLKNIYDNYHFCEQFADDLITFDYLLKAGPSRSTNAIKLLEYMGFDKEIVTEAASLVKKS